MLRWLSVILLAYIAAILTYLVVLEEKQSEYLEDCGDYECEEGEWLV